MIDNTVVRQIDSYISLQKSSSSTLSKKIYIENTSFFLEILNSSTESSSEKTQYHTFFTTLLNIVLITFKNTTLDSFNETMLYNIPLLNLFNNKVLLASY